MKTLPKIFFDRLEKYHTTEELEQIKKGLNINKRPVSFRINTLKISQKDLLKKLKDNNITYKKIDYLENGYILTNDLKENILWDKDFFKSGEIYLQSISSIIPRIFLDAKKGQKILDITAAPGSKTSQIGAIMENIGEIIANDNNSIRIDKLDFTLKRQGITIAKTIKNNAINLDKLFPEEYFDNILADLPCSAEGRINLNIEKSFGFWSEENIGKNVSLQKEILSKNIKLLKVGGNLVYSTCTMAIEENEEIADFILSNFPNMKLQKININIPNLKRGVNNLGIRILPSEETQGFYIVKFTKIG